MKNKDRFDTHCWVNETVTDPYRVIAHLFFEAHVYDFRKLVE